jgi:hypothetical protein
MLPESLRADLLTCSMISGAYRFLFTYVRSAFSCQIFFTFVAPKTK